MSDSDPFCLESANARGRLWRRRPTALDLRGSDAPCGTVGCASSAGHPAHRLTLNQDFAGCGCIGESPESGAWLFACVADGVSSSVFSAEASEIAVRAFLDAFPRWARGGAGADEHVRIALLAEGLVAAIHQGFDAVLDGVSRGRLPRGVHPDDFDATHAPELWMQTTLQAVAISEDEVVRVTLGDGYELHRTTTRDGRVEQSGVELAKVFDEPRGGVLEDGDRTSQLFVTRALRWRDVATRIEIYANGFADYQVILASDGVCNSRGHGLETWPLRGGSRGCRAYLDHLDRLPASEVDADNLSVAYVHFRAEAS